MGGMTSTLVPRFPPPLTADAVVAAPELPVPASDRVSPPVAVRLSSQSLLGGQREIEIDHDGAVYRLRVTSLGKLILTK